MIKICGFFRTRAKGDSPDVERRLWTAYIIKHKIKDPAKIQQNMYEMQQQPQAKPTQQQEIEKEEKNKNPILLQIPKD